MKKGKIVLKAIIFLVIFCVLFSAANSILKRKALVGAWNTTVKIGGLANEPKDSIDVMFFGSSHMYCSINPLELFHKSGITSYVYSVQQQPIWASYYYIIEALKYQSPKLVVLEMYTANYTEEYTSEEVNFSSTDEIGFSKNKIGLIQAMVPKEERKNHYIEFLKYHTRWKELTKDDFNLNYKKLTDPNRGYVLLETSQPITFNTEAVTEAAELYGKNIEYLDKLIALSKEKGFDLLFLGSPYQMNEEQKKVFRAVDRYAQQNGIPFLDYNYYYDELKLDTKGDYYDKGHVNYKGAKKITEHFSDYLKQNYQLDDKRSLSDYQNWQEDYESYLTYIKEIETK
jgi:hypothetical protein